MVSAADIRRAVDVLEEIPMQLTSEDPAWDAIDVVLDAALHLAETIEHTERVTTPRYISSFVIEPPIGVG